MYPTLKQILPYLVTYHCYVGNTFPNIFNIKTVFGSLNLLHILNLCKNMLDLYFVNGIPHTDKFSWRCDMVESEQKETKVGKRTFQKSRPYPPIGIEEALKFAGIIDKLGGRNISEQILLQELGLNTKTKSFWAKTAGAKQFDLIAVDGKTYTLTERARLLLRPKFESEKKILLRETFLTPELYKDLNERFKGKPIPDTLSNILHHDYSMNKNVSNDAVDAFIESAKFVGLLGHDNVLKSLMAESEHTPIAENKDIDISKQAVDTKSPTITVPIKLSKGMASIILPESGITQKDSERLQKLIDIYVIEESAGKDGE